MPFARSPKIIVGAAETRQRGWFSTNEQWLDITKEADWNRIFYKENSISNIVAEHVVEHLTREEAIIALKLMNRYLIKGGQVRIAVPDGYNPSVEYIQHVKVGGIGDDADDHKQLLNVDTLSGLLHLAGFDTSHVEGYTKEGNLVEKRWDATEGFVLRSRQNDVAKSWQFPDAATSLIVDAVKR